MKASAAGAAQIFSAILAIMAILAISSDQRSSAVKVWFCFSILAILAIVAILAISSDQRSSVLISGRFLVLVIALAADIF